MAKVKRIRSKRGLANALAALLEQDKSLRRIARQAGELTHNPAEGGFEALIEIIVSQQLSVAAADTIFARVKAAVVPFDPETLLATSAETLRAAGLSAPKQKHMRSIASRIRSGELDLAAIEDLSYEDAHAHMIETSGIGPWTADIYLMFSLGHGDAWPVADVALQAAVANALGLRKRPNAKRLAKIGERWRPWRSVAARLFWRHYRITQDKKRAAERAKLAKKKRRKRVS
jgi:DNA-3-methyladenine glycosylase II